MTLSDNLKKHERIAHRFCGSPRRCQRIGWRRSLKPQFVEGPTTRINRTASQSIGHCPEWLRFALASVQRILNPLQNLPCVRILDKEVERRIYHLQHSLL